MRKVVSFIFIFTSVQFASFAQMGPQIEGEEVFRNDDVVFHQLDDHTWVGSGNVMASESVYIVEGDDRAVLIDAGTNIPDLDEIVASITDKPLMVVATHAHPDHIGSIEYFPEIYINPAETENSQFMQNYQGEVKSLEDRQIIDLGGRQLEVVFTPAHTPGSTTFIDKDAGYGFSGDSFGSGNLLLFSGTFSDLIATCEKIGAIMEENGIEFLYPGHYRGNNPETRQRIEDMITLSRDVLSGEVQGEENSGNQFGFSYVVSDYGVRINYSEEALQ